MVTLTETEGERKASPSGLPAGDYRLVGWGIDATGRKVIDEICQIAGYTPSSSYVQCVMPYRNLNQPAKKKHKMKIVTYGKCRMLKDTKANKILHTKSALSALNEFLSWLEVVKGDAADGIVLVYHESREVIPAILLESLSKYKLLARFKKSVKGFVNVYTVAKAKCSSALRTFSLRTLSPVLLNKKEETDKAMARARLTLQIIQHLHVGDKCAAKAADASGSGDSDAATKETVEFIREFAQSMEAEEAKYAELKVVLNRQNALRPIFRHLHKASRRERQRASLLRRLLAEAEIDFSTLEQTWNKGKKEEIDKLIADKLPMTDKEEQEFLASIIESHFDPEKRSKFELKKFAKKKLKSENNNKSDWPQENAVAIKEVKKTKEAKEEKEEREAESKESKESKEAKEAKAAEEVKDVKEMNEAKEAKEETEAEKIKGIKEEAAKETSAEETAIAAAAVEEAVEEAVAVAVGISVDEALAVAVA